MLSCVVAFLRLAVTAESVLNIVVHPASQNPISSARHHERTDCKKRTGSDTYDVMPARVLCAARRLLLTWSRASAGAVWQVSSALAMVPIALCAPLMLLVTLWIPADAVASLRGVRVRYRVVRRQGEGTG